MVGLRTTSIFKNWSEAAGRSMSLKSITRPARSVGCRAVAPGWLELVIQVLAEQRFMSCDVGLIIVRLISLAATRCHCQW